VATSFPRSVGSVRKTEARRHAHHAVTGMVRITWENNGHEVIANAQIVDASISGMRLRLDSKIPLSFFVTCNDHTLGISGTRFSPLLQFGEG
jgi:hypothetical protein